MACNAGPDIIEDGLVLCLDAANINSYPKSGTTWSDLKSSNSGTLTNGPTFSSDNRGSVVFDGTNDYVDFGDISLLNFGTGDFTIECIYKTTYTSSQGKAFLCKSNGGAPSSGYGWLMVAFYNEVGFAAASSGGSWGSSGSYIKRTTGANINDGNFYTITVVADRSLSDVKIYKNAVLQNLTVWTGSGGDFSTVGSISNSENVRLGAESDGEFAFSGGVAASKIYNRALTAEEVAQNYEATVGRYT